jgi:hypothetical protein
VLFTYGSSGRQVSPEGFPCRQPVCDHNYTRSSFIRIGATSAYPLHRRRHTCSALVHRLSLLVRFQRVTFPPVSAFGRRFSASFCCPDKQVQLACLFVVRSPLPSPVPCGIGFNRLSAVLWYCQTVVVLPGHRLSSFRSTAYHLGGGTRQNASGKIYRFSYRSRRQCIMSYERI